MDVLKHRALKVIVQIAYEIALGDREGLDSSDPGEENVEQQKDS